MELTKNTEYQKLLENIRDTFQSSKDKIVSVINSGILLTYWKIGQYIIDFEQKGNIKAEYGKQLILNLSKDLSGNYGRGFSRSNIQYMRLLYKYYPKSQTLSGELSWSHYIELISIDDKLARDFYENQAILEKWSIRELKRQKKTGLFHRLAVGKNKEEVLELSRKGQIVRTENDFVKNPHIFEFMNFPEDYRYTESDIEKAILSNLQNFLLEFGRGFAFVGRQQRITLNNRHFFVDLVFYHIKLKCYVLIDLKIGKVVHENIGQMKLYLGYYAKEISEETDNEPIGIILSEEKDEVMIEYAMLNDTSKLIVSKYQLLLPDINELKNKIREIIDKK